MIPSHTVHLLKHFSTGITAEGHVPFPRELFQNFWNRRSDRPEKKHVKLALHELVSRVKDDAKFFPCIFIK